jgi:hypothetical protein
MSWTAYNYDGGFKYPETFKFRLIFIKFTCMGPHVSLQWFLSGEHSVANFTTNTTVRHWSFVYQRIYNIRSGSSTPHIGVLIFTVPVGRVLLRRSPAETCGWGAVRHRSPVFTILRNHTNVNYNLLETVLVGVWVVFNYTVMHKPVNVPTQVIRPIGYLVL